MLHIRHETVYRYDHPVKHSVQALRLTPRNDGGQRVLRWTITTPGRRYEQFDAHGNLTHWLAVDEPHEEIRILAEGVVDAARADSTLPDAGGLAPLVYAGATALTTPAPAFAPLLEPTLSPGRVGASALLGLAERICERVRYRRGTTDVGHSALDALELGEGVCQDHAHVFLVACRMAGLPARYVSGYVDSRGEEAASHAWADVWIARERVWLSVDVSHQRLAGSDHCRIAVGRDYLDAAPVRGVRRGGGAESMDVAVLIARNAEAMQQ